MTSTTSLPDAGWDLAGLAGGLAVLFLPLAVLVPGGVALLALLAVPLAALILVAATLAGIVALAVALLRGALRAARHAVRPRRVPRPAYA